MAPRRLEGVLALLVAPGDPGAQWSARSSIFTAPDGCERALWAKAEGPRRSRRGPSFDPVRSSVVVVVKARPSCRVRRCLPRAAVHLACSSGFRPNPHILTYHLDPFLGARPGEGCWSTHPPLSRARADQAKRPGMLAPVALAPVAVPLLVALSETDVLLGLW